MLLSCVLALALFLVASHVIAHALSFVWTALLAHFDASKAACIHEPLALDISPRPSYYLETLRQDLKKEQLWGTFSLKDPSN